MEYVVRRKIILIKDDDEETVIHQGDTRRANLHDALEALESLYKTDRAMYRLAITKAPTHAICDDWHDDTAYTFRIGKVLIGAELVDAERYACNIFGLEVTTNENHE